MRDFTDFYSGVYRDEHRHPANVALHLIGTTAGLVWLLVTSLSGSWLSLAFPVVHAVPGLIGHRLFERNSAIGDLRVTRRDYSPLWFIAANHLMLIQWALRKWPTSEARAR
jgi:hypothetical protein